jgi:cytidine deaminase
MQKYEMSFNYLLRSKAIDVSKNAYSPYSNAQVGSAILTKNGQFFVGCNFENGSYGATICAERNAIGNMVANGEIEIDQIYIYSKNGWPPCGMCLQVIREFSKADTKIIIGNEQGEEKVVLLKDILPFSFGPEDMELFNS